MVIAILQFLVTRLMKLGYRFLGSPLRLVCCGIRGFLAIFQERIQ